MPHISRRHSEGKLISSQLVSKSHCDQINSGHMFYALLLILFVSPGEYEFLIKENYAKNMDHVYQVEHIKYLTMLKLKINLELK